MTSVPCPGLLSETCIARARRLGQTLRNLGRRRLAIGWVVMCMVTGMVWLSGAKLEPLVTSDPV